ncbi:hypothetical protein [Nibricoccus sp. IMCC34717]|uniref:hypothetical protein n=1 Tax=Nibricoccus sp. IMCC34717 TaxID=3034021 RepID=UPI00384CCCDD
MRLPRLTTTLALLVASFVLVLPMLPRFRAVSSPFRLEFILKASTAGTAQVYWDLGKGFQEATSSRASFAGEGKPTQISLPIPEGTHRMLRLDPSDRGGTYSLSRIQISDTSGKFVRRILATEIGAHNEIESLQAQPDGVVAIIPSRSGDPQLLITFSEPVNLHRGDNDWLIYGTTAFALLVLLATALKQREERLRTLWVGFCHWVGASSTRLIAITALASTLAATFPVLFLGQSFVSPNNEGATMLYERFPTVPGSRDENLHVVRGSDVGAIIWQHIPYSVLHGDAIAELSLPLWNRYNSCGNSLLGQGQSMFGDPFLLPVVATRGASWAWDLKFVFSRWLFAFAIGGCVWLLTRQKLATVLTTTAVVWVGFFIYRTNHPAIFSFAYAPGVLFSWLWLCEQTKPAGALRATALLLLSSISLLCSGTVKEAYMLLASMHFAGGLVCILGPGRFRDRVLRFSYGSVAGLIFVLVTAPGWLVFLNQLKSAYTTYNLAHAMQIQPGMVLGFFDELFYRPLSQRLWVFNPSLNWFFLVALALFTLQARGALSDRRIRALLLACLPPAFLAFGIIPPEWIIKVPFLANVAHIDNTFSCVLIILLAVISGWAIASASKRFAGPSGLTEIVLAFALVCLPVALWLGFGQSVHRSVYGPGITFSPLSGQHTELVFHPFIWVSLWSLLLATLCALIVWRRIAKRGQATSAEFVLLAVCAGVMLWRNGVHPRWVGFEPFTSIYGDRVDFHARSKAVETVRAAIEKEPARVFGLKANLSAGWNSFLRLESLAGPDALVNPYYRELIGVGPARRIWEWKIDVMPAEVSKVKRFFDALNVRYYLDFRSDQELLGRDLKPLRMGDLDLYESTSCWPRAFFTNRLLPYSDPTQFIRAIETGDGRPFAAAFTGDLNARDYRDAANLATGDIGGRRIEPATDYKLRTNSTSFSVDASGPGIAVLTETWQKGDFRATVDGREVPVLRVNHAFRGVFIRDAGRHAIEIWYHPRGYTLGLWLFAAGVLLSGAALLVHRRLSALSQ